MRDDPFEGLSAEQEGNWVFSRVHFLYNHRVCRTSPKAAFLLPPPKARSWPGTSLLEERVHPLHREQLSPRPGAVTGAPSRGSTLPS